MEAEIIRGTAFFVLGFQWPGVLLLHAVRAVADIAPSGAPRVHKCAGGQREIPFVKTPQSKQLRGCAPFFRERVGVDQAAARVARDSRCTVSTSVATFSGGVAGMTPW